MKIIYLVLVHRNPKQALKMVKALNSKDVEFFFHVDKKSNIQDFKETFRKAEFNNISYVRHREDVVWAAYSIVQATLNGIESIIKSQIDFDYVIILSGQDYPLKKPEEIQKFFVTNKGKEFIECNKLPYLKWKDQGLPRIEQFSFRDIHNRYIRYGLRKTINLIFKKKYPKHFDVYGGSAWWSFSKEFIYFLHSSSPKIKKMQRFFRYAKWPDEMYFQTVIMNSNFKDNVQSTDLHYIPWHHNMQCIDIIDDYFDEMIRSDKLFTRKINLEKTPDILERIDKKISENFNK